MTITWTRTDRDNVGTLRRPVYRHSYESGCGRFLIYPRAADDYTLVDRSERDPFRGRYITLEGAGSLRQAKAWAAQRLEGQA